ncbi:MAG: glycosyltransferase family 39 protein [Anaerolineae bacterium]|nr:glycosyltransferase family 39 protein [Anaerolineae bacterium]
MAKTGNTIPHPNSSVPAEVAIGCGLFLLALLPRVYDLQRFVTADEAKWVYRSARFLAALLQGDFAATSVNLTPAVTTTWLGGVGLAIYHAFHSGPSDPSLVDWLLTLPEFRTELPILAATRWPMALFTSLAVVLLYRLARPLLGRPVALLGAIFIALDPHTISLSRVIGHDAPAAMVMTIALLLLLRGCRVALPPERGLGPVYLDFILSGIAAGLAFLSKAPTLFLIPLAGLVLAASLWQDKSSALTQVKRLAVWGLAAYLTFIILWPAAWGDPLGRPWAVIENAFLSATDQEEADSESYWLVPNLGPFYYVAHGAFKLSPLVTVGLGAAAFLLLGRKSVPANPPAAPADEAKSRSGEPEVPSTITPLLSPTAWLILFALLFTLFMTLGGKRSPRYILPIFPALAFVAAGGWLYLYQSFISRDQAKRRPATDHRYPIFVATLTLSAVVVVLPYAPYFFTYFNPIVGGPFLAPHVVKYGWGEGLDQVGRFLQRTAPGSRVGTPYASTVAPYFDGRLADITGDHLDYVVLYSKQWQSGEPSPEALYYYSFTGPLFSVDLNGLHYGDVYPGPALEAVPGADGPLAFRPLSPYGMLGQPLLVDVVWSAQAAPPPGTAVTLQPLSALSDLQEDGTQAPLETALLAADPQQVLAQGEGSIIPIDGGLVVSRYTLAVPDDLARGPYALLVDGQPLGEIELRQFHTPDNLSRAGSVVFGDQIGLVGYQINPTHDFIGLTIAWQAETAPLPDYTVFAQLLEAETDARMAGIDTQPLNGTWPTSRWVQGEVVVDDYLIAVPYGFEAGYYKVIVGLYQPETGQRLQLADGLDYWTVPWTFIRKDQ